MNVEMKESVVRSQASLEELGELRHAQVSMPRSFQCFPSTMLRW
jgi:hypothetical protein